MVAIYFVVNVLRCFVLVVHHPQRSDQRQRPEDSLVGEPSEARKNHVFSDVAKAVEDGSNLCRDALDKSLPPWLSAPSFFYREQMIQIKDRVTDMDPMMSLVWCKSQFLTGYCAQREQSCCPRSAQLCPCSLLLFTKDVFFGTTIPPPCVTFPHPPEQVWYLTHLITIIHTLIDRNRSQPKTKLS